MWKYKLLNDRTSLLVGLNFAPFLTFSVLMKIVT
jgi:hypothetical protein